MIPIADQGFEEVQQDHFYSVVGPQDACLSVQGNFPYKTVFKLRHSYKVIGYVQEYYPTEYKYPTASKYFLAKT